MNIEDYNKIDLEYLESYIYNNFKCKYCLDDKYLYCSACIYIHGAIFELYNLCLIY